MAVSKRWTNWAVILDTTAQGLTEVVLDGVQSVELNSALRTGVFGSDGSVYNSFGALVSGAPAVRLSTTDLKTLFDACGITGMAVDNDGDNDGVRIYWQRMAAGGTRDAAAAGTHVETIIANGLMVLRSLELSHQSPAVASAEIFARKESSTAPLAFDEAANLTSGVNPASDVQWTLGKVTLNATDLEGLSSVSLDFGVQVLPDAKDSDIYPTFLSIARIQPVLTIRGAHIDITGTLTEDGVYYTASQVVFYAKKRSEGGTFVADGTAEHIKFTMGKCRVDWESVGSDPKEINMRITPWDTPGGTAPLAINTASAIS